MSTSYQAAPDCPLEIRMALTGPLATRLVDVSVEVDEAGACSAVATLELAEEHYARCRTQAQLGLDPRHRGPGPEPEPGRPVRVVVQLRPHLAALLGREEDPMAALLVRLLAPPAELAHAEAWRARDVTQEIAPGVALGYRMIGNAEEG